jgi:hypothetical protein
MSRFRGLWWAGVMALTASAAGAAETAAPAGFRNVAGDETAVTGELFCECPGAARLQFACLNAAQNGRPRHADFCQRSPAQRPTAPAELLPEQLRCLWHLTLWRH